MIVFFSQILAVFRKEIWMYKNSTIAFVFLFAGIVLAGIFFFIGVITTQLATMQFLVKNLSLSLLFLTPILTMHLISSERQSGTLEMLLTSPLSIWALILGKWLSTLFLCLLLLILCCFFPILLQFYAQIDWMDVLLSLGSVFLCFSVFSALGLFAASFFQDRVSSVIGGIFVLLPLWLCGIMEPFLGDGIWANICQEISFSHHVTQISSGMIDFSDVFWFGAFGLFWLYATYMRLSSYGWRMS